ncbi:MAG: SIR2 family protein [Solirubrobacteraceae bacterium]
MPTAEIERLRSLLKDAVAAAGRIGDDVGAEPEGVGYFAGASASGIEDAIQAIAAHDGQITMFVGAGVSMEAELPSWNELVRKLLVDARKGEDDTLLKVWADTVMRDGELAAAAVAEALYPDDGAFRRALRDALYERDASTYAPGALAGQIAWLKERLGSRLALLTVNYDGLLEDALAERELDYKSYVGGWHEPEGKAAVWHLHGRLIRDAKKRWLREGSLVLSEGSYVRSTAGVFPQNFVAERLRCSLCVFVGLSMTDPNFIRWLYRSAEEPGGQRFVIFVRQASPVADPLVRQALEESAVARWGRYSVTPVWANYYGEVAQIVHEIGLRCNGGQPVGFAERARRRLVCARERLSPSDPREFLEAQSDASAWLRGRLHDIAAICEAEQPAVDLSAHRLGLALWGVDHEHGEVVNWASSDRAYQEPGTAVANPLHVDSRWVAATAIASGVSVQQDPKVYASRWRFVRAIPIVVQPDDKRSVVGAITLTSTTPLEDFPLARALAPAGLLNEIDDFLAERASQFFLDS